MSIATQEHPTNAGPEPMWGRAELSILFGVGDQAIRKWERSGKLPKPMKVGRKPLWEPQTIRAFIAGKGAS